MKKAFYLMAVVLIAVVCLSACSFSSSRSDAETGKIQIVTTIFPEYDWVKNILGENPAKAEVTMLLDTGVDFHSFQPTVEDILKISTCDLFIYVGGESDEWVDDALKEAVNKDMIVINLMDVLGDAVKEEEVIEGMQEEHEHEDADLDEDSDLEHDEDLDHEHEEDEIEYDEHVWLSLKNAAVLVENISDALQKLDPDNAELYKKNSAAYVEKLNTLDGEYQAVASDASVKTLLFGDRFPFRYLVDDYGLSYYAAFAGCSAETEASFETITFLAQKADELSLPAVMTIEGTEHRIAETIVENTQTKEQQILTLDSMQDKTAKDVENGTTYLSIMEKNLSVLKEALKYEAREDDIKSRESATTMVGDLTGDIDVDLTVLSSTMVYAEVYNMMASPEEYIGKTVKMDGLFACYPDAETGNNYFACIVQDATACCAQGIEFILADDYTYPDDYPEVDAKICVVGVFDTYREGKYTYCTLRNAAFV